MYILAMFIVLLCSTVAMANCVVLNVSDWIAAEREYMERVATVKVNDRVAARWVITDVTAEFCARNADVSVLNAAELKADAQALHQQRLADEAAKEAEETEVTTELDNSQFCMTATLTQINERIDAQHNAIQVDVDAITNIATAKTALTTQNTRQRAINKAIAKCIVAYIAYQRLQQEVSQ